MRRRLKQVTRIKFRTCRQPRRHTETRCRAFEVKASNGILSLMTRMSEKQGEWWECLNNPPGFTVLLVQKLRKEKMKMMDNGLKYVLETFRKYPLTLIENTLRHGYRSNLCAVSIDWLWPVSLRTISHNFAVPFIIVRCQAITWTQTFPTRRMTVRPNQTFPAVPSYSY